MIKNLNQLKRALQPGMRLEVIGHCRPGCIGQLREVTWVNTQGFYTKTLNPPNPKLNAANEGRGVILWWGAARTWEFEDGVCKSYTHGAVSYTHLDVYKRQAMNCPARTR